MSPDPASLATIISSETGLEFAGSAGVGREGHRWIALIPTEHDPAHTFTIRTLIEWRRLAVQFEPGKFAGPLLETMSQADETSRAAFSAVMNDCEEHGAVITLRPNGKQASYDDSAIWIEKWSRLEFSIRRGNIELGTDEGIPDNELVREWTSRFVAAVIALLPLEEHEPSEVEGYPEGAVQRIEVNRYERDRRNRSAALAIHGHSCAACGMDFEKHYGPVAAGFIEIHHVVPVSRLGQGYVVNPKTDLVPLCPNCHSVAHRRSPPLSVDELRNLLRHNSERSGMPD